MKKKNITLNRFDKANLLIDTLYQYIETIVSSSIKHFHLEILKNLDTNSVYITDLVLQDLHAFYEHIIDEKNKNELNPTFIQELFSAINLLKHKITRPEHFYNDNSINSEKYYTNKIKELTEKESLLKRKLVNNENRTDKQRERTKNIELKLENIENELETKKKELELKQKQEDAKDDWEVKINNTFLQLKDYLNPIKKEYKRLNALYYIFAILSVITLALIIIIEVNAISKISSKESFPILNEYIMLFLPLPIAGALMWGFIFQMNRAQRQLILISNNIHSINYIQGLLIAVNNLSPNVKDSIVRINNALDKVISNHLNEKYITDEPELIKEENKDNLDIDKISKLIKTIRDTAK